MGPWRSLGAEVEGIRKPMVFAFEAARLRRKKAAAGAASSCLEHATWSRVVLQIATAESGHSAWDR